MKKLLTLAALFGFVCAIVLTGCKKEEAPAAPATPSTNAPAQ
ncbi:MAG TPA: hypothetical protein VHG89_13760 [Verrucomicrobiae bacterium]|nr:hypothetical protein [Verrucomicrobiae bacterium]